MRAAQFIGTLLSWMLLGISVVQLCELSTYEYKAEHTLMGRSTVTDIYHVSFARDHRFIQTSVYTIFLLDVFQSIVAANEGWQVLIAGWGRTVNIAYPGWTFIALPIVSSLGIFYHSYASGHTLLTWSFRFQSLFGCRPSMHGAFGNSVNGR